MEIQTNTRNDRTFTLCSSISTEGCFLDAHLSAPLYTCQGIISGLILTLTLKETGDLKKMIDFTVILKSGRSLRSPNNMDAFVPVIIASSELEASLCSHPCSSKGSPPVTAH